MKYYVDFNNKTDRVWTMGIYQTLPESIGLDSVAWQRTTVPHSGSSGVDWEITYSVAIADYKQSGGIGVYKASQTLNSLLGTKWEIVFEDGVQQLKEAGSGTDGYIIIQNNSNELANPGIGMSGEGAVYKRNILAGTSAQFKVTPTYWVGLFDDVKLGEVISSNVTAGPLELKFPNGTNKAILTATMDGSQIKLDLQYQQSLVALLA